MNFKYNDYELLYLINEGSEEAFEILFDKYTYLINKRVKSFKIQDRYKDDFKQEGYMSLLVAINSFNQQLYKKSFNKYFDLILQRTFVRLLKKDQKYFYETTLVEDYTLINYNLEEDNSYIYEELEEFKNNIRNSKAKDDKKVKILLDKGLKPKEISSMLGLEIKKVYNIIYSIKNKANKQKEKN